MKRLPLIVALLASMAVLFSENGYGQDKKDDAKKDAQAPAKAAALPQGFGKLGITGDQKKSILAVVSSYQAKIGALKDQMDQLKKDEYAEAYKLLTDLQKDQLKKNALDKVDPGKGKDDKTDDKKKGS